MHHGKQYWVTNLPQNIPEPHETKLSKRYKVLLYNMCRILCAFNTSIAEVTNTVAAGTWSPAGTT